MPWTLIWGKKRDSNNARHFFLKWHFPSLSHWEVSPLCAAKSCLQTLGNIIRMHRPFTMRHYAPSRGKGLQHRWSILPSAGLCEALLQIRARDTEQPCMCGRTASRLSPSPPVPQALFPILSIAPLHLISPSCSVLTRALNPPSPAHPQLVATV